MLICVDKCTRNTAKINHLNRFMCLNAKLLRLCLYPFVMCTCVDEFGVAAQIAEPLADVQMSTYYISTYGLGHTLVCIDRWKDAVETKLLLQNARVLLATRLTMNMCQ